MIPRTLPVYAAPAPTTRRLFALSIVMLVAGPIDISRDLWL